MRELRYPVFEEMGSSYIEYKKRWFRKLLSVGRGDISNRKGKLMIHRAYFVNPPVIIDKGRAIVQEMIKNKRLESFIEDITILVMIFSEYKMLNLSARFDLLKDGNLKLIVYFPDFLYRRAILLFESLAELIFNDIKKEEKCWVCDHEFEL